MSTHADEVRFFVFDIESVADPELVGAIRHPTGDLSPAEAIATYRTELMEKKGTDFIPYTFQVPISLGLAKVRGDYSLIDLILLRVEELGPNGICRQFWRGWNAYKHPTLVTFNGRGFDIPLLELMAFRYGIPIPDWFALHLKSYDQPRNRFNSATHWDLCEFLTNYGAVHFTGGLNLAAQILHKPGKIETKGDMVQDTFDAGQLDTIHDYCRCDVLDTYFLFLRALLVSGKISPERESELIAQTKSFLEEQSTKIPIYKTYLEVWAQRELRKGITKDVTKDKDIEKKEQSL